MNALAVLLFGAFGAMAAWTVVVWAAIALAWTPAQLYDGRIGVIAFVALVSAATAWMSTRVLAQYAQRRTPPEPTAAMPRQGRHLAYSLVAAVIAVAAWLAGAGPTLFWLLLVVSTLPLLPGLRGTAFPEVQVGRLQAWEWLGLAAITGGIVFATTLLRWANPDDAHFLDAAASFLSEPNLPLFALDTLFQVYDRPNYVYLLNLGQSWDALAGYAAMLSGYDLLLIWYVALPAYAAAMAVLVMALFGKLAGLRWTMVGVAAGIAGLYVLAEVAGAGAQAGRFLELRMYQGKAPLILAGLPLCLVMGLVWARVPGWRSWLLLSLTLVASAGMSSTGLYTGPLAAGLGALMGMSPTRAAIIRTVLGVGLATLPCLWALVEFHLLRDTAEVMANYDYRRYRIALPSFGEGLGMKLQYGAYGVLGWAVLVVGVTRRNALAWRLGLLAVLLCMNPWAPYVLRELTGIMNIHWRYYWLMPVGLLMVVVGAAVFERLLDRPASRLLQHLRRAPLWAWAMALVLAVTLGLLGQPWLSATIGPRLHLKKVEPGAEMIVRKLNRAAKVPGAAEIVVAAPEDIARNINQVPFAPRQLFIRRFFFRLHPPPADTAQRQQVLWLMDTLALPNLNEKRFGRMVDTARQLGVTHLVVKYKQVTPARLAQFSETYGLDCESVTWLRLCTIAPE